MRVHEFRIRNFRAFGPGGAIPDEPLGELNSSTINLQDNLVLLIGANNVGKSTVLRAYEFFRFAESKPSLTDFFRGDESNAIVIEAVISADEDELAEDKLKKWFNDSGQALVRKFWDTTGTNSKKKTLDPETSQWVDGAFGGLDTILQNRLPVPMPINGYATPDDVVSILQSLLKDAVYAKISDAEEFSNVEKALDALKNVIEGDEYLSGMQRQISEKLSHQFPGAEIKILNPPNEKGFFSLFEKTATVDIEMKDCPRLGVSGHGHGLQRQFVMAALQGAADEFAKVLRTKSKAKKTDPLAPTGEKLFLIEEPELFLNPLAQRRVRDALYRIAEVEGFQVIAATHSPILVDLSKDHQSIARVNVTDAGSQINQCRSTLYNNDDKKRLKLIRYFNSYSAEAFFANSAILVEGEAEVVALRTIFRRFEEETSKNFTEIGIVNCGSISAIPLLQEALTQFHINYIVIHDLDRGNAVSKKHSNLIWANIQKSIDAGLSARRLVLCDNLEDAHNYDPAGDKPLSAMNAASEWDLADHNSFPLIRLCLELTGDIPVERTFTPDEIGEL